MEKSDKIIESDNRYSKYLKIGKLFKSHGIVKLKIGKIVVCRIFSTQFIR